ncbi:hypothetical protein RSOLAG1IB_06565 [Rhizoctonia solani AG-1 IB]|uniref:DUF6699 domain-containing protein n=1 Tax=Thanatephorus cucumeris (strain AG1-IB / isolate 7/3/14) TaxID=1108050 RepID=A0A0B7FA35_THACB|nr:hypothetical protein RSOLAG1IB_06565 [Rhizoctonia solani AG-1 IB]
MAARVSQYYAQDNTSAGDFVYPEPNYPYLYAARSDAGYTTPAVSHAPLPPPSVAPTHHSGAFSHTHTQQKRHVPVRTYSDTSGSSGGDSSFITPSRSASQVGNRHRDLDYAQSYASPRSQVTSFVSREDLRNIPNGPPDPYMAHTSSAFTPRSKPPVLLPQPVFSNSHPPSTSSASSSSKPIPRRLRGVLKKPRTSTDDSSYTSTSSAPDVVESLPPIIAPSAEERTFAVPPPMTMTSSVSPSATPRRRQSRGLSMAIPSSVSSQTAPHFKGSSEHVSRYLSRPWDARSPPRLDSATRNAPAFDVPGIQSIQLIVAGLPWSVHVRAGVSRPRSSKPRSRPEQMTVGDVVDCVYASLNKSLTRSDVRAASSETKKRIARASAAAEHESQRGEHSARTGKPSAARRIDFLGSRVWFMGIEKNDRFARREGYGLNEGELQKVWVMRFSSTSSGRATTVMV